jgi:hypothetical protein
MGCMAGLFSNSPCTNLRRINRRDPFTRLANSGGLNLFNIFELEATGRTLFVWVAFVPPSDIFIILLKLFIYP